MPSLHQLNFGLTTSVLGLEIEAFSFTSTNGTTGTIGPVEQGSANMVQSITPVDLTGDNDGTLYSVQLNKPYPPTMISCSATLGLTFVALSTVITPTTAYYGNDYSPTTGKFTVYTQQGSTSTSQYAPTNYALNVLMFFQRYKAI